MRYNYFLGALYTEECVALMIFDACLNVHREIPCVWGRRQNTSSALYGVIRYGGLAVALADIAVEFQGSDGVRYNCVRQDIL